MMNVDIERAFLMKFVVKEQRHRIVEMLGKPKKRDKFRGLLPHSAFFDPKWIFHVPKEQHHADNICHMLTYQHAPETCYVMSSSYELDGRKLPLKDVLVRIVGKLLGGTILICLPDRLAYFEGEEYGDRYIIHDRL